MTSTTTLNGVQAKAAVIKLQANPVQRSISVCPFDHDELRGNGNFLCNCKKIKKNIENYEYDKDVIFKLKHRDSGRPYIPESEEGDEYLVKKIKEKMVENKENKLFLSNVVDEVNNKVFLCNPYSRIRPLFVQATKEMETSSSDDNSIKAIRATLAELTNAMKSSVVTTNENLAKTSTNLDTMGVRLDTMGVRLDGTLEAVDLLGKESKRQGEQLVVHTKELGSHKKLLGKHEERISNNEFRMTATERKVDLLSRQLARSARSYTDPTRLFEGDASPATATSLPVAYGNSNIAISSIGGSMEPEADKIHANTNKTLDKLGVRPAGTPEGVDKQGFVAKKDQEQLVDSTEALDNHHNQSDKHDDCIANDVLGAGSLIAENASINSALSQEEEKVALVYRKMLKMKVPSNAVRHKMELENVDQKIVISVLGQGETNEEVRNRRNIKPCFHWNALPSGQKLTKSIWAKSKVCTGGTEQQAISKHIELFQKKQIASPTATQPKKSQNGGNDKPMAKLIDLKRANNVSISLKAFKDFSNTEPSNVIEFIDPLYKLHGDLVSFLSSILPTALELNAIADYEGSDDALVPAEKWFKRIAHVKRAKEKVAVLMTMDTFKGEAEKLMESFQQLIDACNQVLDNEKLPDLLGTLIQIGRAKADFKLDYLPQLAQKKLDKVTTALESMVKFFIEKGQREVLMLSSDFPDFQNVSRIVLTTLIGEVKALGGALKSCRQELEHLSSDSESEPAMQTSTRLATSSSPTPSQALFGVRSDFLAALKARTEQESPDSATPAVADLPKSARNLRGGHNGGGISPRVSLKASMEKDGEVGYTLGSATRRVQTFLSESDPIFPNLEAKRDEAIGACNKLSEFFCDSGGEKAATLLGILAEFAGKLDRAVKKHDEQQKVEDRKQRAVLKRKEQGAAQNNIAIGEKKAMPPGEKSGKMPRNPLY